MQQETFVENNAGRHKDDFYRTPAPCTQALVDELKRRQIEPRTILDVGCGDGAIGRVLRLWRPWEACVINGVELDKTRRDVANFAEHRPYNAVFERDWLSERQIDHAIFGACHDLIISNPPFRHALRFLELALQRVRPSGHVFFLLPSQWDQETNEDAQGRKRERGRFLDRLRLPDGREGYGKLNYEGRVDFRGDGKTDRITYAWYGFGPGLEGVHTRIPRYEAEKSEQLMMEGICK